MEQVFCQSCGMPLDSQEVHGTNQDGSLNPDYCHYCYKAGKFTEDITMDQMIEHCVQYLDEFNDGSGHKFTKEEAIAQMKQYFPSLKRWKV